MGRLLRLLNRYENEPLLASDELADSVFNALERIGSDVVDMQRRRWDDDKDAQKDDDEDKDSGGRESLVGSNGIGILQVRGPLTTEPTMFEALCGEGASYITLVENVRNMIEDGATMIVMEVDSGGGEAYRCFESAAEIREMVEEADIPLIGYIDGMAASAAYALVCVCDDVFINPDAEAGSIGVVTRLVNRSKAEDEAGIKTTYVYAGDNKIPFNEDGEFREDFISDLQMKIDRTYSQFVAHVAAMRSDMSEESVRGTQANVFTSEDAVSLGLVDRIATVRQFQRYARTLNNSIRRI